MLIVESQEVKAYFLFIFIVYSPKYFTVIPHCKTYYFIIIKIQIDFVTCNTITMVVKF